MQQAGEFGIDEAKRVLADVFAPWVQDLNLSIEQFDIAPPAGGDADWQPGAILRMPFSEQVERRQDAGRACHAQLKHDPEKCEAVFRKDHCANKRLKRDDDSTSSHLALE